MGNVVIGTGSYLPERVVTNQEIQDWGVDYDPARSGGLSLEQWGQKYVGGSSRHWVAPGQASPTWRPRPASALSSTPGRRPRPSSS